MGLEVPGVVAAVVHRHEVLDPRREAPPVLAEEAPALHGVLEDRGRELHLRLDLPHLLEDLPGELGDVVRPVLVEEVVEVAVPAREDAALEEKPTLHLPRVVLPVRRQDLRASLPVGLEVRAVHGREERVVGVGRRVVGGVLRDLLEAVVAETVRVGGEVPGVAHVIVVDRVHVVALRELLDERDEPLVRVAGPARRAHPRHAVRLAAQDLGGGGLALRAQGQPLRVLLRHVGVAALGEVEEPHVEGDPSLVALADEHRGQVEVLVFRHHRGCEALARPEEASGGLQLHDQGVDVGLFELLDEGDDRRLRRAGFPRARPHGPALQRGGGGGEPRRIRGRR